MPVIHQDPEDDDIDDIAVQGNQKIAQVLIPNRFKALGMGFEGPAEVQNEIVGHGDDEGQAGGQKIIDVEQVDGPAINSQVYQDAAAADQGKADELIAGVAGSDQAGLDIGDLEFFIRPLAGFMIPQKRSAGFLTGRSVLGKLPGRSFWAAMISRSSWSSVTGPALGNLILFFR
jgi:hypothetical protein